MANAAEEELENPPVSLESPVWEHYGFTVTHNDNGKRQVDKTKTVCRHCATAIVHAAG